MRTKVNAYGVKKEGAEIGHMIISRRACLPEDVKIKIRYCGCCMSDRNHADNIWKESFWPQVQGHEIIGTVEEIGELVTEFSLGDWVAVGNLVNSCRVCKNCNKGDEQYCENLVSWVYNGHERNPGEILPLGEITMGGYSELIVVNKDFVLTLPVNLTPEKSAPLLCAGITVYSALRQYNVKGKKVGIAGIGGLGHLAVKMAKAMGAEVCAITHSEWKIEKCYELGANSVIYSANESEMKSNQSTLDLVIDTLPNIHSFTPYLNLLKTDGALHVLGLLMEFTAPLQGRTLINNNLSITGSNVGGISLTREMLQFCEENNIEAEIELVTLDKVRRCFDKMLECEVAFRYVFDIDQSFAHKLQY